MAYGKQLWGLRTDGSLALVLWAGGERVTGCGIVVRWVKGWGAETWQLVVGWYCVKARVEGWPPPSPHRDTRVWAVTACVGSLGTRWTGWGVACVSRVSWIETKVVATPGCLRGPGGVQVGPRATWVGACAAWQRRFGVVTGDIR